jgi:hypothetical protein
MSSRFDFDSVSSARRRFAASICENDGSSGSGSSGMRSNRLSSLAGSQRRGRTEAVAPQIADRGEEIRADERRIRDLLGPGEDPHHRRLGEVLGLRLSPDEAPGHPKCVRPEPGDQRVNVVVGWLRTRVPNW